MWRIADGVDARGARWSRRLTLGVSALFLLLVTRWHPWHLFDRAGFTNDFYDAQARAMLHLRFDVPASVAGPEGFVIGGKTFVYFGPLLSVARMPFALIGHAFDGRLTRVSMLIGFVTFCTASYHFALEGRRLVAGRHPERSSARDDARTAAFVGACAVSPVLVLAGWTSVYHETEMWGAALCAWTFVHAIRFAREPVRRHAVLTAVLASATVLTRATMGFGAAVAAGLVALLVIRRARRLAIGVIGGTAAGALVHFGVAYAKLRSLFEMPWLQQRLTLVNTTRQQWFAGNGNSFFSVRFLPTTLLQYLRPDAVRFERLAPFVRFGPLASDVGGYPLETNTPSSSLTVTATVLLVLAVAGAWLLVRWRAWPWLAALAGGAVAALPSFLIGFVAARYLADMVPMLMVPAAVAAYALHLPRAAALRRLLTAGLVALIVWGAWSNASFATWIDQLKNPGFTAWRYELDDHLFGNPAPGLVVLDANAPVPRDGVVGLDLDDTGGCRAVYIVEQGAWVALERANGANRLSGTLSLDGTSTAVVGSDSWTIFAEQVDGGLRLSLEMDGAGPVVGDVVRQAAGAVDVTIVDDALTHELSVTVDGRTALFTFAVPPGAMAPYAALAVDGDRGDTLCRLLMARR